MIVSVDTHEMNKIKWIDYDSMMACIEAGVIGTAFYKIIMSRRY